VRILLFSLAALVVVAAPTGCESTQSKSARLEREGGKGLREQGISVKRRNPDVQVVSTHAVQDQNGTAVVVDIRNKGKHGLSKLPVAIDVKGEGGKSLFRNDTPGMAPSLVQAPVLMPGRELLWVNDQVNASDKPRKVEARVGKEDKLVSGSVPDLAIKNVKLQTDPVDGTLAVGQVVNRSNTEQRKLVVFGVSRSGRKVVAAGRAQVNRLKAHSKGRFQLFFIGDPRRGKLTLAAPPTVLQ
jgi:hypothetical protein